MDRKKFPYVGMVNHLDKNGWKIRNPEWVTKWDKDAIVPPDEILAEFCPQYSYSQMVKIKINKDVEPVWVLYAWLDYYSDDTKNAQYENARKPKYKMVYYGKRKTGHNIGFTADDVVS